MIYALLTVIFIILFCLMLMFYKYLFDLIKYFDLNKKKYVKYIILVISIIIFYGSFVLLYLNRITSVFAIFNVYVVLFGLIYYLLNIFLKKYKVWNKYFIFLPVVCSFLFTLYGVFNMTNIHIKEYNLKSDKLNNNYKIALISDLHYGVSLTDEDLKRECDKISKLNLDFVVLAGDITDERTSKEQMIYAYNTLGSIKTKYGVFYVYGNHDKNNYSFNKTYTYDELKETIKSSNIMILEESIYLINDDLTLIGRGFDVRKEINDLLKEVDKNRYTIIVDHIPKDYKINEENGIDLELSGHTHDGQYLKH